MLKKFWLTTACAWTILIALLCLVSFNDLPKVSVGNIDKYVHAAFHFIFTVLWYMYLRTAGSKAGNAQILFKIVAGSVVYGVAIEFAQAAFTKSRQADATDALANFCGALIACLLILAVSKWLRK